MLAVIIALITLLAQPAPPTTVAACLLVSGYSAGVPATPITELAGVNAWPAGTAALTDGAPIGTTLVADSAGTRRMVGFYAYAGGVYVFVYKHPDDPARALPGEPPGTWHGDCLLRVGADG